MLSIETMCGSLAERLGGATPESGERGSLVFALADGMRLGIVPLPGDTGVTAWSEVVPAPPPGGRPEEQEARAADFLRNRLARLRREGGVVATRGEGGELLLAVRLKPANEAEWLEAVRRLLNETEAMRRIMARDNAPRSAGASLFAGMAGLLGGRP